MPHYRSIVPTTDFSSPRGLIFPLVKGTASWLWVGSQGLLETGECLVTAEGSHQHRHSHVTDGIALQATDTGQGTVDVAILGPGGSCLTQPGAVPMGFSMELGP